MRERKNDPTKEPVEVEDVECLEAKGNGLKMRILVRPTESKIYWFSAELVKAYRGEVQRPGDRGTLTLPRWLAEKEGLV